MERGLVKLLENIQNQEGVDREGVPHSFLFL